MTKALTIHERIMLLNILPREGNILTLRTVRELRERLSFTEQEHQDFGFVVNNETGAATWSPDAAKIETEIEIGETMSGLIKDTLKDLNEKQKLTEEHIGIYEKFVGV